jgi:ABC-type hemin transport system ATPase subunit
MLYLCFQDVTMRDRGRKVVEGLNIKLSAAKSIALIGAPRTGKTGFLLMAGGYVKPTGGEPFDRGVLEKKVSLSFIDPRCLLFLTQV